MKLPAVPPFGASDQQGYKRTGSLGLGLGTILIALVLLSLLYVISSRRGTETLLYFVIALPLLSVLIYVSFRTPQITILVYLLSIMGLRAMIFIPVPGLPDMTLDRIAVMWVFGVLVMKALADSKFLKGPYLLDGLIVAHGTYLLLSILFTESKGMNAWSKSYLMPYGAYFVAKYFMADYKWVKRAFAVLVIMSAYNGFTSIAEHFHWNQLIWPRYIADPNVGILIPGRSRGIFMQAGVLGTALGMLIGTQIFFMRTSKNRFLQLLMLGALGLAYLGIYFTYTRGTWLVGISVLILMAVIGFRVYAGWIGRLVVAAVILFSAGLLNVSQDKFAQERFGTNRTLTGRIQTAATAFRIFRANPIFGVGFWNYNKVKYDYMETMRVPIFGLIRRDHGIESTIHDIYLGVLSEEGLVGMGLQVSIYLVILRTFLRKYRWRKRGDPFAIYGMPVLGALFLGYLIGGIAFDYRFFSALPGLFYFFAGILYGYQGESPALVQPPLPAESVPEDSLATT